jgi:hypothetical protein
MTTPYIHSKYNCKTKRKQNKRAINNLYFYFNKKCSEWCLCSQTYHAALNGKKTYNNRSEFLDLYFIPLANC